MCADNQFKVENVPLQIFRTIIWQRLLNETDLVKLSQTARKFTEVTRTRLFRYTVSDRLHKRILYVRKFNNCVPLTWAVKWGWFQCWIDHCDYSIMVWRRDRFTHVSRFCIKSHSRHITISKEQSIVKDNKGGGIMVWTGISFSMAAATFIFLLMQLWMLKYI